MPKRLLAVSLVSCIGCAGTPPLPVAYGPEPESVWLAVDDEPELIEQVDFAADGEVTSSSTRPITVAPASNIKGLLSTDPHGLPGQPSQRDGNSGVVVRSDASPLLGLAAIDRQTLPLAGQTELLTVSNTAETQPSIEQSAPMSVDDLAIADAVAMNLPSVLAAVGGQHPVVGMARWRVREAYAVLQQARVMWLPSIRSGLHYHRHDGNYQASNGEIVDVNRNSFLYGLGTGATGAGTVQQPGIVTQFHFADAIFQPKIAERTAWARGHAAGATLNQQLLEAAVAYTELLGAHQNAAVVAASRQRTAELAKITRDFSEAGEGLQADADRLQTELALVNNRLLDAQQHVAVASARLAQAISYDGYDPIIPMDVTVVPLDLISIDADRGTLIGTGLAMRPELKESQALVAAACEAYRREKYAPFVPSVLLGFSTGGFGGGLDAELDNLGSRYDFDAMMSWEVRNLGLGEHAARSEQSARVQQARFDRVRVMDQIAREIAEGHAGVLYRRQQIDVTRHAIEAAEQSYERNLKRIRDGEGLPLEVLQSVQALETANQAYLRAVVDYNRAQFQLQWAQGWPVQVDPGQ